jgi:hypothetical protein
MYTNHNHIQDYNKRMAVIIAKLIAHLTTPKT